MDHGPTIGVSPTLPTNRSPHTKSNLEAQAHNASCPAQQQGAAALSGGPNHMHRLLPSENTLDSGPSLPHS